MENDICEFCMSRGFTDCRKLKGPKTEARAVLPSRPITMYDPSIDERDLQTLRDLYRRSRNDMALILIQELGCTLFSCYGRTISHTGLRHAVLANLYAVSEGPSENSLLHVAKATIELRQKLSSNAHVDDADLYVSVLLAIWHFHHGDEVSAALIHMEGAENLMLHLLSETGESPLRILWPRVREWTMVRGCSDPDVFLWMSIHISLFPHHLIGFSLKRTTKWGMTILKRQTLSMSTRFIAGGAVCSGKREVDRCKDAIPVTLTETTDHQDLVGGDLEIIEIWKEYTLGNAGYSQSRLKIECVSNKIRIVG
jgi:hypothetical protein